MKKLNVAGFNSCGAFQQARNALVGLSAISPTKYAVKVHAYESRAEYMEWLETFRQTIGVPNHKTSPIVWYEDGTYVGGRDDTIKWCQNLFLTNTDPVKMEVVAPSTDVWNANHGFDYDLIVIGGGSGGLACSKEAQKLGAKVAVLDFVKPSPQGSKWGLGGTCVNVGCIPKKLMHNAALLGEHAKDAQSFGWEGLENGKHSWDLLRSNVQDHIKGLNFGYRVQLREAGVTYLNKLGKFIGPNQLECTDPKGKTSVITGARFVIASGGRPTPLDCPGGEYAITSDDLFMKETAPGKTCVVGAGYVALECAGFINGLHQGEVVVLVRSMLLRGFDRDCVNYVQEYMLHSGTRILIGALPKSIEKLGNGRLLVSYNVTNAEDGSASTISEEFDTVLAAIGREADLKMLGLDACSLSSTASIHINPKTGKLICSNEQTSVPHIYAVGDVIDNAPELTPVAILAGKLLARRLFGVGTQLMVYTNVATTVFTPIELGTVGLTEEQAIAAYGSDAVDAYVSAFKPLEWTIIEAKQALNCYAKVVVLKENNEKVLGIQIVAPNAGEIIQGFAVAFNKGLYYKDLLDTVGIHPTIAEEFTTISVTKSSGASIAKSGC